MIVPVKRWANFATLGFTKPARNEQKKTVEAKPESSEGLLEGYEKMWAAHADLMLRNIAR